MRPGSGSRAVDERLYAALKWTAIALGVSWLAWSFYDGMFGTRAPGDDHYLSAETLFEDGAYERALAGYDGALAEAPEHIHALRARARTLMQLRRNDEALAQFDDVIQREPEFGPAYANRGVLHDRMGNYEAALADYERAVALDPELAEGPNWLTRFLRNEPDKPPTVADRARYIREQLAKPEHERLLRVPEQDAKQRSYKQ